MSATERLSRSAPYLERLLEDEYIQEQLRDALENLRRVSAQAQRKGPRQAARDKRLRGRLVAAGSSLAAAFNRLRQPEPPKRHPVRNGFVLLVVAGGGGLAWRQLGSKGGEQDGGS